MQERRVTFIILHRPYCYHIQLYFLHVVQIEIIILYSLLIYHFLWKEVILYLFSIFCHLNLYTYTFAVALLEQSVEIFQWHKVWQPTATGIVRDSHVNFYLDICSSDFKIWYLYTCTLFMWSYRAIQLHLLSIRKKMSQFKSVGKITISNIFPWIQIKFRLTFFKRMWNRARQTWRKRV